MNKHEIVQILIAVYPQLSTEVRQSIYHALLIKTPADLCETYNKSIKESTCEHLGGNMYQIIFK